MKKIQIIPAIVFIVLIFIFFVFINNISQKSHSNYDVLKNHMNPETIKNTLTILTDCGFKSYDIIRDELLDNLDGENTIGFRLKSNNYNAILYIKNGNINSIRYADNDLYRNNSILKKINEIK